jgi:hypothetical protein
MANTSTLSLKDFNELLKSANSTLRQALLAKGEEARITGLTISLQKGDELIVAPGVEPQLITTTGKPVVSGDTVATDAYWAFRGDIRRGASLIKEVTIPVASFRRLGKEFPSLGTQSIRDGRTVPNRSGLEFLQEVLKEYPDSWALYRSQTDWDRVIFLYGEGEGFSLTIKDVREGYTLPYKSKRDRQQLEATGTPWGSKETSWRKISMLFVSVERNSAEDEAPAEEAPKAE